MKISLFCGADVTTLSDATERVQAAATEGFDGVWFAQGFNLDALTAIAVLGGRVPGIGLGTSVLPIQGRHPLPLALAALTAADAIGPGRMTLGIGVSHRVVSEGVFEIPYAEAVARCREELVVLDQLLSEGRSTDFSGSTLSAHAKISAATPRPRLLLAALGPRMLELAGELADGTITWMTGPRALERDVMPVLRASAERAQRPAPVVVAGLPICVTNDVDTARSALSDAMKGPASMPSYRRMLEAEGVGDPVEIALVGSEAEVADRLEHLAAIGVDEVLANVSGTREEQIETRRFLARRSHASQSRREEP